MTEMESHSLTMNLIRYYGTLAHHWGMGMLGCSWEDSRGMSVAASTYEYSERLRWIIIYRLETATIRTR